MALIHNLSKRSLSPFFSPSCPANAKWYACPRTSRTNFVGCCSINPCDINAGCTDTNLQPAFFNASLYDTPDFPPNPDCGGSTDHLFYTCLGLSGSTFWGCCKNNPCRGLQNTPLCGAGNLSQSFLKTDQQYNGYQYADLSTGHGNGGANVGLIAGVSVGGAVIVIAIVLFLILCMRKRRRARKLEENTNIASETAATTDCSIKMDYRGSTMTEAPPTYYSPDPNKPSEFPMAGQPYKSYYPQVAYAPTELSGQSSPRVEMPVGDSQQSSFAKGASPWSTSPANRNPSELEDTISSIPGELPSPCMTPPPLSSTISREAISAKPA